MDICKLLLYQGPMTTHFHHPSDVLRFAHDAEEPCALICVTNIYGGAMRAKGALMAAQEDGTVAGYISNGCVDADIIFQAKEAMKDGQVRRLKYGEGSPFKDIQLPCGGSIDLLVVPNPDDSMIGEAVVKFATRQSVSLSFEDFEWTYAPKLRLRIAGRGEAVRALASQAIQSGFDVHLQSPEADMHNDLGVMKFDHLTNPAAPPAQQDDAWSAVILMFHDHAWEIALLTQALASDAFYIGAMGSDRTHALRVQVLKEADVSPKNITRINGPIGLIPSMRDANLLALSTLAEIVKTAQDCERL
jgi:xanthine dehydrogenase accessory factor